MKEITSSSRIRCNSGEMVGMWLWTMTAARAGLRLDSPNWVTLLQHRDGYTFHPRFLQDESAAYKILSREVAEGFVQVLAWLGIDAEIV